MISSVVFSVFFLHGWSHSRVGGRVCSTLLHWVKDDFELWPKKKNKLRCWIAFTCCSHVNTEPPQSSNQGVDIWNLKCANFISFSLLQLLAVSSDWTFSCFLFSTLNGTFGFLKDFYLCLFFYAFIQSLKCLKNKVFLFKKKPSFCA